MRSEQVRCSQPPLHARGRFCSVTPAEARPLRTTGRHRAERATRQGCQCGRWVFGGRQELQRRRFRLLRTTLDACGWHRRQGPLAGDLRRPRRQDQAGLRTDEGARRVTARRARHRTRQAALPDTSRFSITTTVQELSDWWLESVARHQVRESSLATYRKSVAYFVDELGGARVIDIGPEVLTAWQSALLDRLAPYTVLSCRKACRQIFAEAVKMGLIATNPFDLMHAPRAEGVKEGRALSAADARKLVIAAAPTRLGAAVTLLFCQGWRVSEVLGPRLGRPRSRGRDRPHPASRDALGDLGRHVRPNEDQRRAGGKPISPVFANTMGGLVNRQATRHIRGRSRSGAGDPQARSRQRRDARCRRARDG